MGEATHTRALPPTGCTRGPKIWDAVVVGAGPAGCAAAYDLAAAGHSVLLVDRAAFPRPKACAGGLTRKAVRALRYPIDPVVRRWVSSITLEEAPGKALTVGSSRAVCAMTVREELDRFCLDQTIARGAEFRRIPAVLALERQADAMLVRLADAESITARYVIGADGVHSRVRALATDGRWFRSGFAVEANVLYTRPDEQFPLTFDFDAVPRGYGWLFPRDTHVNVGIYVESGIGAALPDRSALAVYIEARCGAGREASKPVGQFLGLGAAGYRPAGDTRVLLAGDAAGYVDPLTGEGIHGAIRSGQVAAAAVHAALGGAAQGHQGQALVAGTPAGAGYVRAAHSLQADLRVAEHAAGRFFADPARGFRLMRLPLVPRAVLKVYADGLRLGPLLRGVRIAARLARQ